MKLSVIAMAILAMTSLSAQAVGDTSPYHVDKVANCIAATDQGNSPYTQQWIQQCQQSK